MPANDYHFITTWHIPARPEEITEILGDAAGLARWWPSVYLDVEWPMRPARPPAVVTAKGRDLFPIISAMLARGDRRIAGEASPGA